VRRKRRKSSPSKNHKKQSRHPQKKRHPAKNKKVLKNLNHNLRKRLRPKQSLKLLKMIKLSRRKIKRKTFCQGINFFYIDKSILLLMKKMVL
jgi:hypothetical protein